VRKGLYFASVSSALLWCAPAGATELVTTATTLVCGTDCDFDTISTLQSFDSSLGTLTGITLQIDALLTAEYNVQFANSEGPSQTGSALLSYSGLYNAVVNGETYNFPVAGSENFSITRTGSSFGIFPGTFTASGTATYLLDPSVFASFVDKSNQCGFAFHGLGVCASAQGGGPTAFNIASNVENLVFRGCFGTCNVSTTNYTLTYTYNPFAVPEASSWAMMLLGFAGIGFAMRRPGAYIDTVAEGGCDA